jgi:HAMP domain-containing protein
MAENNPPASFSDSTKLAFELRKALAEVERLKYRLRRMRQELRTERAERRRLHQGDNDGTE